MSIAALPRMNGKAMTQPAQPEQNSEPLRALLSQARAKCCDLSLSAAGNITCFFFLSPGDVAQVCAPFVQGMLSLGKQPCRQFSSIFHFDLHSIASMPRFCG